MRELRLKEATSLCQGQVEQEKAFLKPTLFLYIDAYNIKILSLWVGEEQLCPFLGKENRDTEREKMNSVESTTWALGQNQDSSFSN